MAVVERGKGKRKHIIEIIQHGVSLCMQESESGDRRLPGYRRFKDESEARSAVLAAIAEYLNERKSSVAMASRRTMKSKGTPS